MKNVILNLILVIVFLSVTNANAQSQLWGMATQGGLDSGGVIFNINQDGSNFTLDYSFSHASFGPGYFPIGNLQQASNSKCYGICHDGGSSGSCVLFSFDPSTNAYVDVHDFNMNTGFIPTGDLSKEINGKLYGVTGNGGNGGQGVLYSFDINNNIYTQIHNFSSQTGSNPCGRPLFLNNKIYGTSAQGGAYSYGVLYKYNISAQTYDSLHSFNSPTGSSPYANLIIASNGIIYGVTFGGGTNGDGVIFSFDTASNTYTVLHNFDGTNGKYPKGNLIQLSNGLLVGMTMEGGLHNKGVIFTFDITSITYTNLYSFDSATGSYPEYNLMEGSNEKLFGMTDSGGLYNMGVIFSYNLNTSTYLDLLDFNEMNGQFPTGGFITLSTTTNINSDLNNNRFSIYPNPASTLLNIHHSTCTSQETLLITDLLGTVVYKEELHGIDNTISISTWSAGIYFYEVRSEKESVRGKFVVQK